MYSISIIIPAYNAQDTISDCIQSVFSQIKPFHEIIAVNDGSTDNTRSILTTLQAEHEQSNFTIIDQSNQGLSVSRNNAIALAKGRYILLLDADDVLLPDALELLDQTIDAQQPDVITFDFRFWFPEKNHSKIYETLGYQANVLITDKEAILNTFFTDRKMYAWLKVFKIDIYKQQKEPVFPPKQLFEDITAVPKLLNCCQSLFYLPHAIIDYRQCSTGITKSITEKSRLDFVSALLTVKQCLQQSSTSTKLHFDVTACHLYFSVVKDSYQFPRAIAKKIRYQAKSIFMASLFNDYASVLAAMQRGETSANNSRLEVISAKKISKALSANLLFHLSQTVSGKLKLWRRLRKNALTANK